MTRPPRTEPNRAFHTRRHAGRTPVGTHGRRGAGFTLIELLVVIAVIGIVAAILLPVFARVRARARQATCLSNLQQIGLAITQYATDYDESLPPARNGSSALDYTTWRTLIFTYTKDNGIFACPSNPYSHLPALYGDAPVSYMANATLLTSPPVTLVNPNQIEFPSLLFMVGEGSGAGFSMHTPPNDPFANPLCAVSGPPGPPNAPGCEAPEGPPQSSTDLYAGHDGFSNYLFADGHVRALKPTALCKGMDMWDLNGSNNGLPCDPALQTALAANEKYWSQTTQP